MNPWKDNTFPGIKAVSIQGSLVFCLLWSLLLITAFVFLVNEHRIYGLYFVPIFQGSPEVVYPRVNNFSILILILSYLFVILSLIIFSLYFTEDFRGVLKRKKIIKDEWCSTASFIC